MSQSPKYRQFSVRIPAYLVEYVDAEAKKNGRSRNNQIATMIEKLHKVGAGLDPVSRAELNHYLSQINAQLRSVVNEAVNAQIPSEAELQAQRIESRISRINCRMPLFLIREIDKAAEEAGISRRVQVERIVREWCELNPEKIGDRLYRAPESRFAKK
jgi:hypothetical protein